LVIVVEVVLQTPRLLRVAVQRVPIHRFGGAEPVS
jgi:hypothetical protein